MPDARLPPSLNMLYSGRSAQLAAFVPGAPVPDEPAGALAGLVVVLCAEATFCPAEISFSISPATADACAFRPVLSGHITPASPPIARGSACCHDRVPDATAPKDARMVAIPVPVVDWPSQDLIVIQISVLLNWAYKLLESSSRLRR